MTGWFVVNLGDAMLVQDALVDLQHRFDRSYQAAGCPPDMALFMRHVSDGRLHCEVLVYFSPAAADVAVALDAEPCGRPAPEGLDLLAGSGVTKR